MRDPKLAHILVYWSKRLEPGALVLRNVKTIILEEMWNVVHFYLGALQCAKENDAASAEAKGIRRISWSSTSLPLYIVNRLQRPATGVLLVEDYIAHEEAWFFLRVKYNNERHFNFYSLLIGLLIIIKAMYWRITYYLKHMVLTWRSCRSENWQ